MLFSTNPHGSPLILPQVTVTHSMSTPLKQQIHIPLVFAIPFLTYSAYYTHHLTFCMFQLFKNFFLFLSVECKLREAEDFAYLVLF